MQSLVGLMSLVGNLEEYGAQRKQRQQQQRAEQALNKAKGDLRGAADIMEREHGDFTTGRALRDNADKVNRERLAQVNQRLDGLTSIYGKAEQTLLELEANPALYPEIRSRLADLASQVDPKLASAIPMQYDRESVRSMLQSVRDLDAKTRTLALSVKSAEAAMTAGINTSKGEEHWREALLKGLSQADDAETASTITQHLRSIGMPQSVADEFGPWTPETPAQASERLLTPEQKSVAARAKIDDERQARAEERQSATATEVARHNRVMEGIGRQREARRTREERDGTTPTGRATAERWKATQLENLEKEVGELGSTVTTADVKRRQLTIENSYRAQIGLKPLLTLPAAWGGGQTSASAEPPAAPMPSARPAASSPAPSPVSTLLANEPAGRYTLTDGSVWEKAADGTIRQVQ